MDVAVTQHSLQSNASLRAEEAERLVAEAGMKARQSGDLLAKTLSEIELAGHPEDAITILEQARDARTRLLHAEQVLAAAAGEGTEETWRLALKDYDPDQVKAAIKDLEDGFRTQDDAIEAAVENSSKEENILNSYELGSGAEGALHAMKASELEMEDVTRDYLRLKLGAAMLDRVIEQYRHVQSDPLMRAAGVFFSGLTRNAFSGISQEFDEDEPEKAQLVGVRGGGGTVCVDGMSEGQRDQLYLSLRLAFLEDYATKNEPVPFIGDDIFMTFDEESTRAGLLALSTMSERVQPILFTHHRFVADMATEALGTDLDLHQL